MTQDTSLIMADLLAYRRKREVKEACNVMEKSGMFNKHKRKRLLRMVAPCEICGSFHAFLKIEVVKICNDCLEKGMKEEAKEDKEYAQALLEALMHERRNNGEGRSV